MPFNGSGAFVPLSRPTYPPIDGELIQASLFKAVIDDLVLGLNSVLTRDGVGGPSANLPMGGKKHTGAGAASAAGEYLTWGQNATLGGLTLNGGALNFTGTAGGPQTTWKPAAGAALGSNYHLFLTQDGLVNGSIGADGGAIVSGGDGRGFGVRSHNAFYAIWQDGYGVLKGQDGEVGFAAPTAPYARYKVANSTALLELGVTTNAKVLSTKALYLQTPSGDFIIPEAAGAAVTWRGATVWTSAHFSTSEFAPASHNHAGVYQPIGDYAAAAHNHSGVYAVAGHDHAGVYAPAAHNHDGSYASVSHLHTGVYQPAGSYAAASHNHDGTYQPAGSYASASHSHDGTYARLDNAPVFAGLVYGRGGGNGLGQIQVSTTGPSGGANGDLWLVY